MLGHHGVGQANNRDPVAPHPVRAPAPRHFRRPGNHTWADAQREGELRRNDIEPFARILADPVQRVAAARAGMVVDVDHHLHPYRSQSRSRRAGRFAEELKPPDFEL
jgi:hypothetical protein